MQFLWQFIHWLSIPPLTLWRLFYYETFCAEKNEPEKKKYTTSLKYIARILISRFLLQH